MINSIQTQFTPEYGEMFKTDLVFENKSKLRSVKMKIEKGKITWFFFQKKVNFLFQQPY